MLQRTRRNAECSLSKSSTDGLRADVERNIEILFSAPDGRARDAARLAALDRLALLEARHRAELAAARHDEKNAEQKVVWFAYLAHGETRTLEEFEARLKELLSRVDRDVRAPGLVRAKLLAEFEETVPWLKDCTVAFDGPDCSVGGDAAQALGEAVHELCRNAVKHGALRLSDPGDLCVTWARTGTDGAGLELVWTELNSEPLAGDWVPGGGFSWLQDRLPNYGASADLNRFSNGVRWTLRFSDGVEWAAERKLTLLLLEDVPELSLGLALVLGRDYRVSTMATVEDALKALEEPSFDLAVLDFTIGDGDTLIVADRLVALGIPLVFLSGWGGIPASARRYSSVWLKKPVSSAALLTRVRKLLTEASSKDL